MPDKFAAGVVPVKKPEFFNGSVQFGRKKVRDIVAEGDNRHLCG
jgi:hypothetical protein